MRPLILLTFIWMVVALSTSPSLAQNHFLTGSTIDTVHCLSNEGQSYALYLPSNYDGVTAAPIVYIFDPAARGRTGVSVFQDAAEKYGLIVACSNNARNGSWDVVFEAADAIFEDTKRRLKINSDKIYTAGFSGGSRAAMALAVLLKDQVKGVIGCGAGYPPLQEYQPDSSHGFYYLGLVGNRDMNFYEQEQTELALDELGINNNRFIFDGIHEWPPANIIEMAVLELFIRNHRQPKNAWLSSYTRLTYENAKMAAKMGYSAYALKKLEGVSKLLGISSAQCKDLENEISASKSSRKNVRRNAKIRSHEKILIDRYLNAFRQMRRIDIDPTFDLGWWKEEIDYLNNMKHRDSEQAWNYLGWRMLNLIAARSAESAFRNEKSGNFDQAEKLALIWTQADLESPNSLWYRAKLASMQGEVSKAVDLLEDAHKKGLQRKSSLNHEAFKGLRNEPRFLNLLAQLDRD